MILDDQARRSPDAGATVPPAVSTISAQPASRVVYQVAVTGSVPPK
jgi:hypothetical protein